MKTKQFLITTLTAACLATALGVAAEPAACDRACLGDLLDRYLQALLAHDPGAAPLLTGFRQTENAGVVRPGAGLWRTATGLGKMQRRYFDADSGQAAFFGVLEEGEHSAVAGLRMKVDAGLVSEAEWYLGRAGDPGLNGPVQADGTGANLFDPDQLLADPPPDRSTSPPARRLDRAAMAAVVNSYFDGITAHDGSLILAEPGCRRTENGFRTTGRPLREGATDGHEGKTDCTSGMDGFQIALVAARRYPVVDVEAGVVAATAVFLRNAGSERRRNSFIEFFYLDGGRISSIWAAMFYPSPAVPVPNWPPYDGNFPLPADYGAAR